MVLSTPAAALLARNLTRLTPRVATRAISNFSSDGIFSSAETKRNDTQVVVSSRSMATVSAGSALQKLAIENPHVDVIRYEHKNVKWTVKHVDFFAEALAVGFVDNGLVPGDVVLSWMPPHFSEQHILQFACSKAGLILYHLDPSQAIENPDLAKKSLAAALKLTQANVLMTQEAGSDVNYVKLVESVIPETRIFNFADGMPFISPLFPHLRFPIHTGFDYEDKPGFIPLQDYLCPTEDLESIMPADVQLDGKTPLMGTLVLDKDGVPTKVGDILSNEEVVNNMVWPEFTSILKKEYQEIEGVGNVF